MTTNIMNINNTEAVETTASACQVAATTKEANNTMTKKDKIEAAVSTIIDDMQADAIAYAKGNNPADLIVAWYYDMSDGTVFCETFSDGNSWLEGEDIFEVIRYELTSLDFAAWDEDWNAGIKEWEEDHGGELSDELIEELVRDYDSVWDGYVSYIREALEESLPEDDE